MASDPSAGRKTGDNRFVAGLGTKPCEIRRDGSHGPDVCDCMVALAGYQDSITDAPSCFFNGWCALKGAGSLMIQIGIIGYGYWGPVVARNFQNAEGCQLAAVCDSNPAA